MHKKFGKDQKISLSIISSTFCFVYLKSLSNNTSFDLFSSDPMLSFKFFFLAVYIIIINTLESRIQLPT